MKKLIVMLMVVAACFAADVVKYDKPVKEVNPISKPNHPTGSK